MNERKRKKKSDAHLVAEYFDLLGPGRLPRVERDGPVLVRQIRLRVAVMDDERFTGRILFDGDTSLDPGGADYPRVSFEPGAKVESGYKKD